MMSDFPEVFKRLRKEHNYSQYDLAKELEVSRSIIAMYEQGHRLPSFEMLEKIAGLFNVNVHYLMTGKDDSNLKVSNNAWLLDAYDAAPERVQDIVRLTLEPYRKEAASSDLKKA